MEISSINFVQNVLPKNKITNNTNVAFRGGYDEKNVPSMEQCTIFYHPVFELQKQLLQDGYTMEEISRHRLFDVIDIKNIDLSNPNLLDDAMEGRITKDDIFTHRPKKLADIKALQKAYTLLKQKFNTQDVQDCLIRIGKIEDEIASIFAKKGLGTSHKTTCESMILDILHLVDKDNVALLEELLNDENFNNIHISSALRKLDNDKDMKYAHETLKMAQEIGYEKEFSQALAVMISEARLGNMQMIEKMLYEQDFLAQNEDFVCSKMMSFLRGNDYELVYLYLTCPEVSLREIDELMEQDSEI